MKRLFIFLTLALLAALGPIAPVQAQEDSIIPTIEVDPSAAAAASDIIDGVVVGQTVIQAADGPHTVSKVEITHVLAGTITEESVLVETYGGQTPDGIVTVASHTADLELGESYQIALTPTEPVLAAMLSTTQPIYSVAGGEEGAHSNNPFGALHAQASTDYVLSGYYWKEFPLQYQINPAGSGLSTQATIAAVQRGFAQWAEDQGSAITFEFVGTTTSSGINMSDKIINVSWVNGPTASQSNSWIGRATWSRFGDGSFYAADIEMNNNYHWADGAVPGAFDVEWVVKHELGHALGLDHTPAPGQVMFAVASSNGTRELGDGDRGGVRALYPQDNKPAPTPVPTPEPTDGPECDGRKVTVDLNTGIGRPTEGPDVILGTPQRDIIITLGGDDIICAGKGVDTIHSGSGNDRIFGEGGSDYIWAGDGDDAIYGGSGADRVYGEDGNDVIFGNGGQDFLWGGAGNDDIQGNWQSDHIYGGRGDDVLRGAGGKDRLYGETGNDQLYGGLNTDYLNGGIGFDLGDGQQGRDYPNISHRSGCEELETSVSC